MGQMKIFLQVDDEQTAIDLIREVKGKTGLLKDVNLYSLKQALDRKQFPIQIPVDLDGLLKVAGNPLVKRIFGPKIEGTTKRILKQVIETG